MASFGTMPFCLGTSSICGSSPNGDYLLRPSSCPTVGSKLPTAPFVMMCLTQLITSFLAVGLLRELPPFGWLGVVFLGGTIHGRKQLSGSRPCYPARTSIIASPAFLLVLYATLCGRTEMTSSSGVRRFLLLLWRCISWRWSKIKHAPSKMWRIPQETEDYNAPGNWTLLSSQFDV